MSIPFNLGFFADLQCVTQSYDRGFHLRVLRTVERVRVLDGVLQLFHSHLSENLGRESSLFLILLGSGPLCSRYIGSTAD